MSLAEPRPPAVKPAAEEPLEPLDVLTDGPEAVAARSSSRLRPLLALAPYVGRYRGRALLALVALVIAALTTLVVPIAIRRVIDFGFSAAGIALINSYF